MKLSLIARDRLSQTWHKEAWVWDAARHFTFATNDQYFAFCAAKDWLQDTGEVLFIHRQRNFAEDPMKAYLEFWGVLQAVFVHQDAIRELNYSLLGTRHLSASTTENVTAWHQLRDLRNYAVGHPTRQGPTPKRCVSGRQPKSYDHIELAVYERGHVTTKTLNLSDLLELYDGEAAKLIDGLHDQLIKQLLD